jgi:hypothetical protein
MENTFHATFRNLQYVPVKVNSFETIEVITRNTCMQQPLAYIFQTLFRHEVFIITPTLNAGSRCTSC